MWGLVIYKWKDHLSELFHESKTQNWRKWPISIQRYSVIWPANVLKDFKWKWDQNSSSSSLPMNLGKQYATLTKYVLLPRKKISQPISSSDNLSKDSPSLLTSKIISDTLIFTLYNLVPFCLEKFKGRVKKICILTASHKLKWSLSISLTH